LLRCVGNDASIETKIVAPVRFGESPRLGVWARTQHEPIPNRENGEQRSAAVGDAELPCVLQRFDTCSRSRSAINPGPLGSHPSFLRVCALDAGMSYPANIESQPK
jgi:hypothetical protein